MQWHRNLTGVLLIIFFVGIGCQRSQQVTLPHTPPRIEIKADYTPPKNVVGPDVYLQVPMKVYPADGPDAVRVVEALYKGTIIASTTNIKLPIYDTNLFIPFDKIPPGPAEIHIRARSMGGEARKTIIVEVNSQRLEDLALDYIHKFWDRDGYGRYIRLASRSVFYIIKGKNEKLVNEYRNMAIREYLIPWTGLNFIETNHENKDPLLVLNILPELNKSYLAVRYGTPIKKCEVYTDEIPGIGIDAFLLESLTGTLLCIGLNYIKDPNEQSIVGWYSANMILHPYQMKAIRMVYSKPFGAEF